MTTTAIPSPLFLLPLFFFPLLPELNSHNALDRPRFGGKIPSRVAFNGWRGAYSRYVKPKASKCVSSKPYPTLFLAATQNVLDPRRLGKQNSGFSDEDISDIICVLHPHTDSARQEVRRLALEGSPHIIGKSEADEVPPDYELEDDASRFEIDPCRNRGNHVIILKLSSQVKAPAAGFAFGRNSSRCDVVFVNDPLRRVSNIHFRIYVNEHGVVMIEDQSTNGTFVDRQLLSCRLKAHNSHPANRWVLSSGSLIRIPLHTETQDLVFLVRIPHRDEDYDRAYLAKVGQYFARHGLLPPSSDPPRQDVRSGAVDIFRVPGGPLTRKTAGPEGSPSPRPISSERRASPHTAVQSDWKGSGKYNRTGTIGQGAFAVVYKVTSKYDGLPYAAKEIEKRRFIKNGVLDQKVENEMRIMQRVQHVSKHGNMSGDDCPQCLC